MKNRFSEFMDTLEPEELELLTAGLPLKEPAAGKQKRRLLGRLLPKTGKRSVVLRRCAAAVCLAAVLLVGIGGYAVEAKAYREAVDFFAEYDLPMEGLSRAEIKAVYRDIITGSFSYGKTAEVIGKRIPGYEILQENPVPEALEEFWVTNYYEANRQYVYRSEYKMDATLGFSVHDKSWVEKVSGEEVEWSVSVSEFWIEGISVVSDGVIAYGQTPSWASSQTDYAWMAKVSDDGELLWKRQLDNGFRDEYIAAILENRDGSYCVLSRGDLEYFCLSQYSAGGERTHFQKTEIGNYGIWNAACLDDGYIVQLGSYMTNEHARIVKVDQKGNITDSFSYGDADSYYYISDMIAFDGKIYLSAYAVPRLSDEEKNAGGRYEIAGILNEIFSREDMNITPEELTPMVQANYTAMLLVCDPEGGTPQTFYAVKGSLGGGLSVSDKGMLLWDVESIADTYFSPMTSAFTIGGSSCVFRYSFDETGNLAGREETGEVVRFHR